MGLFWDLYQQSKISEHARQNADLASRIAWLESELHRTQVVLHDVVARLEQYVGQDLNADGRIG